LALLALTIKGPPPLRGDPGRSADRHAPNAAALEAAALRAIGDAPDVFPIRDAVGVTVVFGQEPPQLEWYDVVSAIEEVLTDVGILGDERLVEWERTDVLPELNDAFSVTIDIV
jgi:hypothetical protein